MKAEDGTLTWDLWIDFQAVVADGLTPALADYHRLDADGLTHGNVRNARPGVMLAPGSLIVVGNEEADRALAEVVRTDGDGVILVRVLPRAVEDNRSLQRPLSGPVRCCLLWCEC